MAFQGFGMGARKFLRELAVNNDKAWFEENRPRYEREVLEPAMALVADLGPRLARAYPGLNYGTQRNGAGSIMRIHRDVRFARDKSPYKTNLGVIFWIGEGKKVELPCFYFHLEDGEAFFYGGQHQFPGEPLLRYREAVADEARGRALEKILRKLEAADLDLMEEPAWKRVPQGYPADHPRGTLLRLSGIGVGTPLDAASLASAELPARCAAAAVKMRPLMDWLAALEG